MGLPRAQCNSVAQRISIVAEMCRSYPLVFLFASVSPRDHQPSNLYTRRNWCFPRDIRLQYPQGEAGACPCDNN